MTYMLSIVIIIGDLLIKRYAASTWAAKPLILIDGALELTYVENRGAAWGMFKGARIGFIILTIVFLAAILYLEIKTRNKLNSLSRIILALLFAGAFGNLFDRVFYGYVRDMIYFSLINFPVFNIADSAIVIGAFLLIIQTLRCKNGLFDVIEHELLKRKNNE